MTMKRAKTNEKMNNVRLRFLFKSNDRHLDKAEIEICRARTRIRCFFVSFFFFWLVCFLPRVGVLLPVRFILTSTSSHDSSIMIKMRALHKTNGRYIFRRHIFILSRTADSRIANDQLVVFVSSFS